MSLNYLVKQVFKSYFFVGSKFDYHLRPFQAAIDAGASSIMEYNGIPLNQPYLPNNVGMAFSKGIITDLLRKKLGFKGYVNSDTGIIGSRAWGLEDKTTEEQILIAIDAGTDILSLGNSTPWDNCPMHWRIQRRLSSTRTPMHPDTPKKIHCSRSDSA